MSPSIRCPQGVTHLYLSPLFLTVPTKWAPSALLGRKGSWVPRGQDKWDLPSQLGSDGCRALGALQPLPCPPSLPGPGVGVPREAGGPHWEGCRAVGRDRELSLEAIRPQGLLIPSDPSLSFYLFLGRAHGRAVMAPGGSPVASHMFTRGPAQSPSCHLGPSSHCPPQGGSAPPLTLRRWQRLETGADMTQP